MMTRLNCCEEPVNAVRSTLCDVRHLSQLGRTIRQLASSYRFFIKLLKITKMYG